MPSHFSSQAQPGPPGGAGASVASIGRASSGGGTRAADSGGTQRRYRPGAAGVQASCAAWMSWADEYPSCVGVGLARAALGEHRQQVRDVVAAVEALLDPAREPVDAREHRHPPGTGLPVDVGELVDRVTGLRAEVPGEILVVVAQDVHDEQVGALRGLVGVVALREADEEVRGIDAALGGEPDEATRLLAGRGAGRDDQHRVVDGAHERLERGHGRRRTHRLEHPHVNPGTRRHRSVKMSA